MKGKIAPAMEKVLYAGDDCVALLADYRTPEMHSHMASHYIEAAPGKDLHCVIGEERIVCPSVFIRSDIPHTIRCEDPGTVIWLFDIASPMGRAVDRLILKEKDYVIPGEEEREVFSGIREGRLSVPQEERTAKILSLLAAEETVPADVLPFLSEKLGLSGSRISHIFKENAGVSLHRYLPLVKLKKASAYAMQGESLTEAALHAGFDSPSHLAGACKRMFGISLTDFARTKAD